jgi:hypothetical protein
MLASLLLCSVHIPHEAPDSRSTFADFASDESVCPRGDSAPVADTTPGVDTATSDTNSGVDTDSGATLVGNAEPTAG